MQLTPDCIPCILTMAIGSIRKLGLNEAQARAFFTDILAIPGLRGLEWSRTSPDIIEVIMKKICATVNNDDPFHAEKIDLNRRVSKIYPFLKKLVADSPDPINMATKISILGNAIDFMMPEGIAGLEDFIVKKLAFPLSSAEFAKFSQQLQQTKRILLFTDNCGEIVCDKLFIETIKARYDIDFTVVARHLPTLNDATVKEAIDAGLDTVATVVDNGLDGPLPGTVLNRCSSEIQALVGTTDLIIAKGGGNFDSLEEALPFFKTRNLKITFMLLSKCHPIGSYFGIMRNHPIIANYFFSPG